MARLIAFFLLVFATSARAADGGFTEVNIAILKPGQLMLVESDTQPIWILYRTPGALKNIEHAEPFYDNSKDPKGIINRYRSMRRDYFVVYGGCPDGDELPTYDQDAGFTCLKSCKKYDLAGRPMNSCAGQTPMRIPEHYFKDNRTVVVRTKNGI